MIQSITPMQRITVTIPDYLYRHLTLKVPRRGVSRFVAKAVEKEITREVFAPKDPWKAFLNLKKDLNLPTLTYKQIRQAIDKGRE